MTHSLPTWHSADRGASVGEAGGERVGWQARVEQARHDGDAVAERIAERLGCKPEAVLTEAGIAAEQALPERMAVEAKLERLIRERDNMGPVNLRAEAEVAELEQQIQGMQTEREDLVAAIAKLRERKSVGEGKGGSARVDLGGRRIIKKKK